jgi:hypothetical protein
MSPSSIRTPPAGARFIASPRTRNGKKRRDSGRTKAAGSRAQPGCATRGETMEELRSNLQEAIEGCLSVRAEAPYTHTDDQVIELAL